MKNIGITYSETEFKVSKDVINATTKCRNGFVCLKNNGECLCEIEALAASNKICFVKYEKNRFCDYKMSFGYSFICNCPTRRELYKLYRI